MRGATLTKRHICLEVIWFYYHHYLARPYHLVSLSSLPGNRPVACPGSRMSYEQIPNGLRGSWVADCAEIAEKVHIRGEPAAGSTVIAHEITSQRR
jgi:hypothetical protein